MTSQIDNIDLELLSQQLLYKVRMGENVETLLQQLSHLPEHSLSSELNNDAKKMAFWINVYNATTQLSLLYNPDQYKKRSSFFKKELIVVAGRKLSLDDIEHGILRRSKNKLSMGYLNKTFVSSFEKKHRVGKLDYRIHFALNCGAHSCPPIAFYSSSKIDEQLELATRAHLQADAEWVSKNVVAVPAFMNWFRGDFGGNKGIVLVLRKAGVVAADQNPTVHFKPYNWSIYLNNFREVKS